MDDTPGRVRKDRTKLIILAIDLFGNHRKAALLALRHRALAPRMPAFIGRPLLYEPALLLPPLKAIGLASQQPCGKMLGSCAVRQQQQRELRQVHLVPSLLRFLHDTPCCLIRRVLRFAAPGRGVVS